MATPRNIRCNEVHSNFILDRNILLLLLTALLSPLYRLCPVPGPVKYTVAIEIHEIGKKFKNTNDS